MVHRKSCHIQYAVKLALLSVGSYSALFACASAPEQASRATPLFQVRPATPGPAPKPQTQQGLLAPSASVSPEPLVPEPPIYDLKSDIEARIQRAKSELGNRISVHAVKDVFVIIGREGQVSGAARTAELAIEAYLNGRFTRAPDKAVSVYLFPSARPYQAYCMKRWNAPCISGFGFYGHDERQIVLDVGPGVGTLTHELVHPILESDFPKAPTWIDEGIASLYEGFGLGRKGEIYGVKNWRHPILIAALNDPRQRERAHLEALFGMPNETFRGPDESLNYALARYFCLWMEQKRLLWAFYHQWRDNYDSDQTGQKSFQAVTGQSPSEANKAWQRWVRMM